MHLQAPPIASQLVRELGRLDGFKTATLSPAIQGASAAYASQSKVDVGKEKTNVAADPKMRYIAASN